ncbi:MAG: hydroxymethylglutaryl-CoA reductase, degradative [Bacteroidota bacterium]|nr:hydroxymethylglutaryl-CoA reductase, degradative [Bacteroidota bacterium]
MANKGFQNGLVSGFSKKSKQEKIEWIANNCFSNPTQAKEVLQTYWNSDEQLQNLHDEFIENGISNFYLPLAVAPNFVINGKSYVLPMVTEESSVVAAAANAAKFWATRGGFHAEIVGTEKTGQVHFLFTGPHQSLRSFFHAVKPTLLKETEAITKNMRKRGGGILDIELVDSTKKMANYYQLHVRFETADAMGANFINSCLEQLAQTLQNEAAIYEHFSETEKQIEVVMSILSNYVPGSRVKSWVSCPIEELGDDGDVLAKKFVQAVEIAHHNNYRAVTHNKGIMNGVDALAIATGNDFRAVDAGIHAYAGKDGNYRGLSRARIEKDVFWFELEIPLAVGTVGGLTKLHPLVQWSHQLLQNPNAKELMQVMAVSGLAQNFAALRSLVTTGIQKGHMKMHLLNILNQMGATQPEKDAMIKHFTTNVVSFNAVEQALATWRKK